MSLGSHKPYMGSKGRISPLPSYSSAVSEKAHMNGRANTGFFTVLHPQIPGVPTRRLNLPIPIPPRIYHATVNRYGRRKGFLIIVLGFVTVIWTVFALVKRFGSEEKKWPTPYFNDSTLVFQREDLRRIWEWEIASGHYPSSRKSAWFYFHTFLKIFLRFSFRRGALLTRHRALQLLSRSAWSRRS